MKTFQKNDNEFKCISCGFFVPPLHTSSRDHCTQCLHSIHVDVNPGDRANTCNGILKPIEITHTNNKGYIIHYVCEKCEERKNNKAAKDDNFEEILKICQKQQ